MKINSYREKARRLLEFASAQGGYFTAKQALAAGYAASTHAYNVAAGNWEREHRAIYRLAAYPNPDRPDLIKWSLWSCNRRGEPEGVYSHQTVLSLRELSDISPAKIYMSVPPTFRRSIPTPKGLVLHRRLLAEDEVVQMSGFRATTPLRAIADILIENSVSLDHMAQAVTQAFDRGLIRFSEFRRSRLPVEIKRQIEELRGHQ